MSTNDNSINARFFWQTRIRSRRDFHTFCYTDGLFKTKACLSICFSVEKFFFHDFRFSFPRESSFPRRIPGSDVCMCACKDTHTHTHTHTHTRTVTEYYMSFFNTNRCAADSTHTSLSLPLSSWQHTISITNTHAWTQTHTEGVFVSLLCSTETGNKEWNIITLCTAQSVRRWPPYSRQWWWLRPSLWFPHTPKHWLPWRPFPWQYHRACLSLWHRAPWKYRLLSRHPPLSRCPPPYWLPWQRRRERGWGWWKRWPDRCQWPHLPCCPPSRHWWSPWRQAGRLVRLSPWGPQCQGRCRPWWSPGWCGRRRCGSPPAPRPAPPGSPPGTHTHTHTHVHIHTHTMYTYTYTCTHTHVHIHTHIPCTHTHTYMYTYMHIPCTHTHMYTYTCTHTHTMYTYTHTMYTYTHIHVHIHAHTMYTYTHIHMYTYTHIPCTHTHTMYTYTHIPCTHTHTYHIHIHTYHVHIHTYTWTHTHTYHVHIHTYHVHIHTYTWTHTHTYHVHIHSHTTDLPTPVLWTAYVLIFRFLTRFFCRCTTNQSKQKQCQRPVFYHSSCKNSVWTHIFNYTDALHSDYLFTSVQVILDQKPQNTFSKKTKHMCAAEKGSGWHSTLWGREQSVFNQINICTVLRTTLGRLLRGGVECMMASWAETETETECWRRMLLPPSLGIQKSHKTQFWRCQGWNYTSSLKEC